MKLEYKILWIENDTDFLDSFPFDEVADHIKEQGFLPSREDRSSDVDMAKQVNKDEYDLLIVDYNITHDGSKFGSDLIQSMRENKCLTEVIFYSSNKSAMLAAAATKQLEGVYFSDREYLATRIKDIFDLTVRKVLDVNNMRGFVMAGVASIEIQLGEVIRNKYKKLLPQAQIDMRRKLVKKALPPTKQITGLASVLDSALVAQLETVMAQIAALEPTELEVLLASPGPIDAKKRADTVIGLCRDNAYLSSQHASIKGVGDLLKWRNALAHQREEITNGIYYFSVNSKEKSPFDAEQTKRLRKSIRKYVDLLDTISQLVDDQPEQIA